MTKAFVSDPTAPEPLVQLQLQFTRMLRTPLSTRTGTFLPELAHCDPELLATVQGSASTRLGVYQRQYWLRLFTAMQTELPLSSRLIGLFRFNQLAQLYLEAHAPAHHDLGRIADEFIAWLARTPAAFATLKRTGVILPKAALTQAVELDLAWQRVWMVPDAPRWQPSIDDAKHLATGRLIPSPRVALFDEDWPLVALRQSLRDPATIEHIPLPRPLSRPRHWALMRTEQGIGQLRLEPKQALLYRACTTQPLDAALSRLQAGCSRQEKEALPSQVQQWFALSIEMGFWSGVMST